MPQIGFWLFLCNALFSLFEKSFFRRGGWLTLLYHLIFSFMLFFLMAPRWQPFIRDTFFASWVQRPLSPYMAPCLGHTFKALGIILFAGVITILLMRPVCISTLVCCLYPSLWKGFRCWIFLIFLWWLDLLLPGGWLWLLNGWRPKSGRLHS